MWTYCLPDLWPRPALPSEDPRHLSPAQIRDRADRARALLDHLRAGLVGLPGRPDLTDRERAVLGARVFGTAPLFAETLVADLKSHPALYPDLRARQEALTARSQEAACWHDLRGTLGALYAIAHDNFLLAQSEATGAAVSILGQLDAEVQAGSEPSPRSRQRWHGAMTARLILRRHRDALNLRPGRAAAEPAAGPAAGPAAAPSPQRRLARAQLRRQRTIDIERIFRRQLAQRTRAAHQPTLPEEPTP